MKKYLKFRKLCAVIIDFGSLKLNSKWQHMQNCRTCNENTTVFTVSMIMAILFLPKKNGWSEISGTEFIAGKIKHSQVPLNYLFQRRIRQIVWGDSHFLMYLWSVLFWYGLQLPCCIQLYLQEVLEPFLLQDDLQPEEGKELPGGQNWWVSWMETPWYSRPLGMAHCQDDEARHWK